MSEEVERVGPIGMTTSRPTPILNTEESMGTRKADQNVCLSEEKEVYTTMRLYTQEIL